jgi:hypothetical protein
MDKNQNHFDNTTTMTFDPLSIIYQTESQFNIASLGIGNVAIPFICGMTIGITAGFLRG